MSIAYDFGFKTEIFYKHTRRLNFMLCLMRLTKDEL